MRIEIFYYIKDIFCILHFVEMKFPFIEWEGDCTKKFYETGDFVEICTTVIQIEFFIFHPCKYEKIIIHLLRALFKVNLPIARRLAKFKVASILSMRVFQIRMV